MDLPNSPDYEGLFHASTEWILLQKSISVLEVQLEQAYKDIERLSYAKTDALANPDSFISLLQDQKKCSHSLPKPQTIYRVPDIDIQRYQKRTSRRGNTKYEQNLEYLLAKIIELQKRHCQLSQPLLSTWIPITSNGIGTFNQSQSVSQHQSQNQLQHQLQHQSQHQPQNQSQTQLPNHQLQRQPSISSVREMFYEIAGNSISRSASVPAFPVSTRESIIANKKEAAPKRTSPPPTPPDYYSSVTKGSAIPSSSTSSTTAASGARMKRGKRAPRVPIHDATSAIAAHYNLPWSEEEKRRMNELLLLYPEEEVQARRFAKIAAALGTRTASQIANRLHKLQAKRARYQNKLDGKNFQDSPNNDAIEDGELLIDESQIDPSKLDSAEYKEYLRLKAELERLEGAPISSVTHDGYQCDACGIEPIRGTRWHCLDCPANREVDLCNDCQQIQAPFTSSTHDPQVHRLVKINKFG